MPQWYAQDKNGVVSQGVEHTVCDGWWAELKYEAGLRWILDIWEGGGSVLRADCTDMGRGGNDT